MCIVIVIQKNQQNNIIIFNSVKILIFLLFVFSFLMVLSYIRIASAKLTSADNSGSSENYNRNVILLELTKGHKLVQAIIVCYTSSGKHCVCELVHGYIYDVQV